MTNRPLSFEEIVDRCLEEITAGHATVEACLERYPEHGEELEPLLRAATALADIPVPEVTPDPARRAAFMAQIRSTPQVQPRFRLPSLPGLSSLGAFSLGGAVLRGAAVAVPAAAIALIALVFVWTANPSTASATTLTVFAGTVEQQVDGQWVALADGATVDEGMTIRTQEGAFALVTFPDGSTAAVDASTVVTLERVSVTGTRAIALRQGSGRIWNDVVPITGSDSYVVRTPHAEVQARGTVFATIVDGETAVVMAEGAADLVAVDGARRPVQVSAGEVVHASRDGVSEPEAAPVTGEIRVTGPVVAYLTSPQGAATGVLPNGVTFRQIPGITTTDVTAADGSVEVQRMLLVDAAPGTYSLVLRRIGAGDAAIVIETAGASLAVSVPADAETARLPVDVAATDGTRALNALASQLETVEEAPEVRVVESPRTRAAVDLTSLLASRTPTDAATRTPEQTATVEGTRPASTATRPAESDRPGLLPPVLRPDDRDDDEEDRDETGDEATRAPEPTERPTAPVDDEWVADLQDAVRRGDREAIRALVDDVAEDGDRSAAARAAALAELIADARTRERILEALGPEGVRELLDDVGGLDRSLDDTLDDALGGLDGLFGGNGPPGRDPDRDDAPDPRDDDRGSRTGPRAPGDREGGLDPIPGVGVGAGRDTTSNDSSAGGTDRGGSSWLDRLLDHVRADRGRGAQPSHGDAQDDGADGGVTEDGDDDEDRPGRGNSAR